MRKYWVELLEKRIKFWKRHQGKEDENFQGRQKRFLWANEVIILKSFMASIQVIAQADEYEYRTGEL